jgi:hypothetical protein
VVIIGLGKQVYGFAVVMVAVIMAVPVTMIVAMAVIVPMIVPVARLSAPGSKAKLTHFAVHRHLAQMGFNFAIAQNLHQLRMAAHLRQIAN